MTETKKNNTTYTELEIARALTHMTGAKKDLLCNTLKLGELKELASNKEKYLNYLSTAANSHFLRTAGPHSPDSPGHIKRTVLEISRAERGLRPANQYRALSQKAMPSQSVR